jgi:uncharacterized protein (UPF0333 family)
MSKEPDPKKEPLQSKKKTSPVMMLLVLILFVAAAGLAYFYVKNDRLPTTDEMKQAAADTAGKTKDTVTDLAKKAKEWTKGAPFELVTTPADKNTRVVVTLKKDAVDEFKSKYAFVQVIIPELQFNEKAPKSAWPVIGTKDIIEYHPIKADEVSCTVNGITDDGKVDKLYERSAK